MTKSIGFQNESRKAPIREKIEEIQCEISNICEKQNKLDKKLKYVLSEEITTPPQENVFEGGSESSQMYMDLAEILEKLSRHQRHIETIINRLYL